MFSKCELPLRHNQNMPMKRPRILFTIACILLSQLLDSCHSSRKAVSSKSHPPKFINDVSIAPHNKNNVTHNAIDPKKFPRTYASSKPIPVTVSKSTKVDKVEPPNVIRKKYAAIIGVKPKEITNSSLYQFIEIGRVPPIERGQ